MDILHLAAPCRNVPVTFALGLATRFMRALIRNRTPAVASGAAAFVIPTRLIDRSDEIAVGLQFICDRKLFGWCYQAIHPWTFRWMNARSGVFIAPFVASALVDPTMKFPGDIDLLVIPYHNDELLLSRTLAVELKIVRASFARQGKSPNEFGFSQSRALLDRGFPFVATGHLIISDESPKSAWRTMHQVEILDAASGRVSGPTEVDVDTLPSTLIDRSFGRMLANCDTEHLGLFAAYPQQNGVWIPRGRKARRNKIHNPTLLDGLKQYFEANHGTFLDTPAKDPVRGVQPSDA